MCIRDSITCPESSCRAEIDAHLEQCTHCATPLRRYVKLLNQHHRLFNKGLECARREEYSQARDAFAAIVAWCPQDIEARNALAMACFALRDWHMARAQWQKVLELAPDDAIARQGLEHIPKVEGRTADYAGKIIVRAMRQLNHAHDNGRDQRKKH